MASQTLSETRDEVNLPLWIIGWHGRYFIIGLAILLGVVGWFFVDTDTGIMLGFLSFFVSPIIWYLGVREINGNYKTVLEGFENEVGAKVKNLQALDETDEFEAFGLRSGFGKKFMRKPKKRYELNSLLVTDYSAVVHDDAELNMVWLNKEIGRSTRELYYDSIADVNYEPSDAEDEPGEFWINMTDGIGHSWPSDREPDDALNAINRKVRDYKRGQVS